jgi:hypothetical protein
MRLEQVYTGMAHYHPDRTIGAHRLFVAVSCYIEDLPNPFWGLLDPAAEWCVLPADAVSALGIGLQPKGGTTRLSSRLGVFEGHLERLRLRFPADAGQDWEIEATCFVSPDWPGPMVIGWKGCLEWMRFALDPGEDAFYFGAL